MVWQICHRLAQNPLRPGGGIAPRRAASGLASRLDGAGFPVAAAALRDGLRRRGGRPGGSSAALRRGSLCAAGSRARRACGAPIPCAARLGAMRARGAGMAGRFALECAEGASMQGSEGFRAPCRRARIPQPAGAAEPGRRARRAGGWRIDATA